MKCFYQKPRVGCKPRWFSPNPPNLVSVSAIFTLLICINSTYPRYQGLPSNEQPLRIAELTSACTFPDTSTGKILPLSYHLVQTNSSLSFTITQQLSKTVFQVFIFISSSRLKSQLCVCFFFPLRNLLETWGISLTPYYHLDMSQSSASPSLCQVTQQVPGRKQNISPERRCPQMEAYYSFNLPPIPPIPRATNQLMLPWHPASLGH